MPQYKKNKACGKIEVIENSVCNHAEIETWAFNPWTQRWAVLRQFEWDRATHGLLLQLRDRGSFTGITSVQMHIPCQMDLPKTQ